MIRPLTSEDQDRVARFIEEQWGGGIVVAHGQVYEPQRLPGFSALLGEELVGLVTYSIHGDACEVVTLDSLRPNIGIGSALLEAVAAAARQANCRRLWLITTNDNLHARRFYQQRGFRLVAVHRGAVNAARALKPQIPLISFDGIPIEDELELERKLGDDAGLAPSDASA